MATPAVLRDGEPVQRATAAPAIAVLFVLAVLAGACGGGSDNSTAPATTSATEGAAGSNDDRITIKDFVFVPATLEVRPGASVTVENSDEAAHTLTAVDKSFDTGNLAAGASGTVSLPDTAGTYEYLCSIHNYMKGSLRVVA